MTITMLSPAVAKRCRGAFCVGVWRRGRIGLLGTRAPDFCAEFGLGRRPIPQWAQRSAALLAVSAWR